MNQPKLKLLSILSRPTSVSRGKQLRTVSGGIYSRLITPGLVAVILAAVVGGGKTSNAQQADYTNLRSLRAVAYNEDFGASVDFEATVTYVNEERESIFVQKGDDARDLCLSTRSGPR